MATHSNVDAQSVNAPAAGAIANLSPTIRKHGPLMRALHMPLASAWILLRFLLVPVLWVPYKLGRSMKWAFKVDSFFKRTLYPLSECPDDNPVRDVEPNIPVGGAIPKIKVRQYTRWVDIASLTKEQRLLLVLFRGSWCPYSRLHLSDLASVATEFRALGITVLAVSAHDHRIWWRSKGVDLKFGADPTGELFAAMGVKVEPSLAQRVWGMLVPHESVFLFEKGGTLIASDVRRLSSFKPGQTFLSAKKWLDISRSA